MHETAPLTSSADLIVDHYLHLKQRRSRKAHAGGPESTIPRRRDQSRAPLSLSQEGHWLLQLLFPDNAALNTFTTWRPGPLLDRGILEAALTEIVRRHDVLRTNFRIVDGAPVQFIRPPEPMVVGELDLGETPPADRKAELVRWLRDRTARPFDLAVDALFRSDLVRFSEEEHLVLFNLHHIICDGWSLGVLARETTTLYEALSKGRRHGLSELPLQYGDYAAWQRSLLREGAVERQLSFWRARLADAPEKTALPVDRPPPPNRSFRGAQASFSLEAALVSRLRQLCQREHATLFMVMIGTLAMLLHRYSGATDIVIGSPVANRGSFEVEPLIGLFMNTVAFRFDLSGDPRFRDFLSGVRADAMEVFSNQDVAFESVLKHLGIPRENDRSPLFQVMFVMQPPRAASVFAELGVDAAELTQRGSKFDLTVTVGESEDGDVSGIVEYATDLFEPSTIARLLDHFVNLLEAVATDPRQRLAALPMLGEAERRQAVSGWNATHAPYPEACVHDLVARQALRTPDAVALRFGAQTITYKAMDDRANRLASHLRELGVGPDVVVGLCMRRSPEQVIGLLGILKAGGAYLPLDPAYPPDRLSHMLADARPRVVVSETASAAILRGVEQVPIVRLDGDHSVIERHSGEALRSATRPDNLAYVIYTSGSTGRPKGVMGTHRAVVNRLMWDRGPASADEVYVHKTTLGFIDALWEIFMPLIRGQSMIVVPDEIAGDPPRLVDLLSRDGATRMVLVPSLLRSILDAPGDLAARLQPLRHWASSGEALSGALASSFRARLPEAQLLNIYGASEFWDATSSASPDPDGCPGVPIGVPISNMRAIVLGPSFEIVPVNGVGELFIGGAGLARGYLGRPGLTADRFLPDPFNEGERIYRTGDLVRRRTDGVLEFVGRQDHQVKLRGHRIELAEVEAALRNHPNVRHAVVEMRDDLPSRDPGLVAYLVADGSVPTDAVLRTHLRAILPSYMMPAVFVALPDLPMTPSGKVDRSALPPPESKPEPSRIRVAPQTALEQKVAGIWGQVLGVSQIGLDDNFFELGGGSLTLVRVQGLISEQLGREVPVVVLFRYPTIRAIGSYLLEGHRDDTLVASTKRGEARQKFLTRRSRVPVRPTE